VGYWQTLPTAARIPTEIGGMIGAGVWTLPRFLMVEDLLHAGLADVDDR